MNRLRIVPAATFVALTLFVAACGGSASPDIQEDAPASDASAAPATPTEPPSLAETQPQASARQPRAAASRTPVAGRTPGAAPARPTFTPSAAQASVERDITYCSVDGVDLKLDIYQPSQPYAAESPLLVYVHGGGWTAGDKSEGSGVADIAEFLRRGYVVAAVNYRLSPEYEFPAHIEDVKCAIRFLRANAEEYGIDADRIGAWGGSAGGHLVNMLGLTEDGEFEGDGGWEGVSSSVQAVADLFGPADFTVSFTGGNATTLRNIFGIESPTDPLIAEYSPVSHASADDPPFLILHGEEDILVPIDQSERLRAALQAVGVESELVRVAHAGHSFSPSGGTPDPTRRELTQLMADFFDEHLK